MILIMRESHWSLPKWTELTSSRSHREIKMWQLFYTIVVQMNDCVPAQWTSFHSTGSDAPHVPFLTLSYIKNLLAWWQSVLLQVTMTWQIAIKRRLVGALPASILDRIQAQVPHQQAFFANFFLSNNDTGEIHIVHVQMPRVGNHRCWSSIIATKRKSSHWNRGNQPCLLWTQQEIWMLPSRDSIWIVPLLHGMFCFKLYSCNIQGSWSSG